MRALSARPLTALGRWALSIYVLHWPLYLLMADGRVPLDGARLALTEMAAAIALGAAFHVLVERPLLPAPHPVATPRRRGAGAAPSGSARAPAWRSDHVFLPALAAVAVVLAAAATAVPVPAPVYDFAAAQARISAAPAPPAGATRSERTDGADGTAGVDVVADPASSSGALNLGVFGGSTGVLLASAMFDWDSTAFDGTGHDSGLRAVPAWSHYGCGFLTDGVRLVRAPDGSVVRNPPDPECRGWQQGWLDATGQHEVQVGLVVTGVWETSDWILDGTDQRLEHRGSGARGAAAVPHRGRARRPGGVGDPRDPRLRAPGRPRHHRPGPGRPRPARRPSGPGPALQRAARATSPPSRPAVAFVDYGAYIDSLGAGRSAEWLPDGIHPIDGAAHQIWSEYLGPTISDTIAATWPDLVPGERRRPGRRGPPDRQLIGRSNPR